MASCSYLNGFFVLLVIILLPSEITGLSKVVTNVFANIRQKMLDDYSIIEFTFDHILHMSLTLGLYGYVYNKKIMTEKIWGFVFVVHIIALIYEVFTFKTFDIEEADLTLFITLCTLALFFVFFEFLALYRYGFKSSQIWNTSKKDETK